MNDEEKIKKIAENIKKIRLSRKLSQAQFGEIIGKSQSTVYGYENGDIIPPLDICISISSIFNVPVSSIIGLEKAVLPTEKIRELYTFYRDLYEKGLEK